MISKFSRNALFSGVAALGLLVSPTVAMAETLADAMIAAYRNSNLLDQNRATLRAADEEVATAVSSLRPVLQWAADFDYAMSQPSMPADRTTASLELTASMTLYDFGRNKYTIDMKKESVLATRAALLSIEQEVLIATVSAYTSVKSKAEQVSINQNSVRVIGEELKAAQDRFEVGEVTRTDVALAEASLAAARASLSFAQGELTSAREDYKAITGKYPTSLAAMPAAPQAPKTLDEAIKVAQRNHPSIAQLQHNVTAADLGVALAAANRRPTLTGALGVEHGEEGVDSSYAGLSLSQTIYSGGALSSAHRTAVAGRDQARSALLQGGIDVSKAVAYAWSGIEVARAQIRAFDEQIRAARVAYNGVREEATLGARTTLEVLDAEQDLLDAQASRIDADATLQVAYYTLLQAMGLLTVENLKLGIPTYDPAAYYNAVKDAPYTSSQGKSLDRVLRAIGQD
ncbi:TolC family outer membrane protein [Albirhodobacter sp. R86504]|jgi:outer membrane protein|uniref:TolC family outer membrane protein n=1 Tax=Albirhodobacter sp. R86504 TaxID=3093848 RepID=UPI003670F4B5